MRCAAFVLILLLCMAAAPAVAQEPATTDTLDSASAAAQVTVTEKTIDPEILMRGDQATISVIITNNGDESVPISRVFLSDPDLTILEGSYDAVGAIGAGNSMTFTFTVRADVRDGIYYPKFSINFRNAPSLRDYIPVKVESTELEVSLVTRPDTFSVGNKETISLRVGNPRENTINGISIVPRGDGVDVEQSGYFIGKLDLIGEFLPVLIKGVRQGVSQVEYQGVHEFLGGGFDLLGQLDVQAEQIGLFSRR